MSQVYTQARNTLSQQGVTGVEVPPSTYYLTSGMFDTTRLDGDAEQHRQLGQARAASTASASRASPRSPAASP